jgi:outer membrane biosynthesis protein TonB
VYARRPDNTTAEIVLGVICTGVVHTGLIVLLLFMRGGAVMVEEEPETRIEYITTELLMYGEVMPDDGQLPWIPNPEPAPEDALPPEPDEVLPEVTARPEQETVVLEPEVVPDPPAEPTPTENRAQPEPREREAPPRRDRGDTNPNRPTNTDPTIGSQDGFVGGTSLSESALRNQFSIIASQISREVRRPAGISDADYRRLSARVHIRVNDRGQITSYEFQSDGRSGNAMYDGSVEAALNSFRQGRNRLQLNSLNPEVRTRLISNGIIINVVPPR